MEILSSYEQRGKFYSDVESLITPGFLSHQVKVKDLVLHFRTLFPGEFYLLQTRTHNVSDAEWKRHLISHSLWMVGGELVSGISPVKVSQIISKLSPSIIQDLAYVVSALMRREIKAQSAIEIFVLEDRSRQLWRTKSHEKFVIPGLPDLGWNRIQRMWMAYNESADDLEDSKKEWDRVKILAGVHNSKAIQAWEDKDALQEQKYQNDKQEILDQFFLRNLGVKIGDGEDTESSSEAPMYIKTVDDLEEEFRKWREGEMDEHDMVVESYKQRILAAQKAQEEAQQKRWESIQSSMQEDDVDRPLVAYTPEQLNSILRDRPKGRQIYSDNIHRNEVLDRHLVAPEKKELAVTNEGQIVYKDKLLQDLNSRQVRLSHIEGN